MMRMAVHISREALAARTFSFCFVYDRLRCRASKIGCASWLKLLPVSPTDGTAD